MSTIDQRRAAAFLRLAEDKALLEIRVAMLEEHLRRADEVEATITAEQWFTERDRLLGRNEIHHLYLREMAT